MQNQPVCLKQMLNYQRLWAWCQLCYISQELILFTYTVVIKKGKLQHAAVYIGNTTCQKEVLWRLFFFNVKIITWSLCCWPPDLQRIINFELTDTSNNQYCTVLVKRSFCAQVSLSLKLQQRCIGGHTMKPWAIHSLLAFTVSNCHRCDHRWSATLKTYKSQPHII